MGRRGAMMSGFKVTNTILTSCQTFSVRFKSVVLCSQIVLPEIVLLSQRKPDQHRRFLGLSGSVFPPPTAPITSRHQDMVWTIPLTPQDGGGGGCAPPHCACLLCGKQHPETETCI